MELYKDQDRLTPISCFVLANMFKLSQFHQ